MPGRRGPLLRAIILGPFLSREGHTLLLLSRARGGRFAAMPVSSCGTGQSAASTRVKLPPQQLSLRLAADLRAASPSPKPFACPPVHLPLQPPGWQAPDTRTLT